MKFSAHLREKVDPIWNASFEHPFIKEIEAGILPLDKFAFYVQQDSFYLSRFAQAKAIGAAKSPNFYTTSRMAFHAQSSYNAEHELHEQFAKDLNLPTTSPEPAPTALAYTNHLLSVAYNGTLGEIVSAILPCYWLYMEIGERLQKATPDEAVYQKWISAYGGEWFTQLVNEQIDRLNDCVQSASEVEKRKIESHFVISSQYEYKFWEMAYTMEQWPVQPK